MKRVYRRFNSGCGLIKHLARGNTPAVWRRFLAPDQQTLRYEELCNKLPAIVSLSRPGRCAGCVPLHLLISKLLRSGEHLAARALQSLPECRVRWTLYGTSLTVEVA